jgi:hypothetical protein
MSNLASDELIMPLPKEEATPPVVKMYRVSAIVLL